MIRYETMTIDMYDELIEFWRSIEWLGLSVDDEKASLESFLSGNKGLSYVATSDGEIVGAVLCGHDFRRGSIYHLAVAEKHRRRGIARELLDMCVKGLAGQGIRKCTLVLLSGNKPAYDFYVHENWTPRDDLKMFSKLCQ